MIRLNIHEAKTHLSQYLEQLAKGETIIIMKTGSWSLTLAGGQAKILQRERIDIRCRLVF